MASNSTTKLFISLLHVFSERYFTKEKDISKTVNFCFFAIFFMKLKLITCNKIQ